ncbi:hypothetical protein ACWJJH_12840 [Endozoicomonadaceae bacterium StTr2]
MTSATYSVLEKGLNINHGRLRLQRNRCTKAATCGAGKITQALMAELHIKITAIAQDIKVTFGRCPPAECLTLKKTDVSQLILISEKGEVTGDYSVEGT